MDLRKKRTIIINFIAGPGAGKTILAALTFAELKLRGKICEYVQEYAKTLVWLKKFELLNDQYFVSSHQNDLLRAITSAGKVDYVITDGPLLNGLYYNRYNPDNVSAVDKTEQFVLDRYAEFDNFNIYLHRGTFPYEQEGRLQTLEQAKEVDRVLLAMLKEKGIPLMEIPSSPESVKVIVDTILGVSPCGTRHSLPPVPEVPKPPILTDIPKPPASLPKPPVVETTVESGHPTEAVELPQVQVEPVPVPTPPVPVVPVVPGNLAVQAGPGPVFSWPLRK